MIRQAVILCGGLGTRLGELTAATPKPLLPVAGEPFLEVLIGELGRHGFDRILLLAGAHAEKVVAYAKLSAAARRHAISLEVTVEPLRAGTAGALKFAAEKLERSFLLLNGDSWFDINLHALTAFDATGDRAAMSLALRAMSDAPRYGVATLDGDRIVAFDDRTKRAGPSLVNAGVYVCNKDLLLSAIGDHEIFDQGLSLEGVILPALAAAGLLKGLVLNGYFIDIGVPDSYSIAQFEIPGHLQRGAVFFDRDGVLNEDIAHVGTIERFRWIDGAVEAVRACNNSGYYAFVVTNQAGVAKGFYEETHVRDLHQYMQKTLHLAGAHLDDIRYCPYHPDAVIPAYKRVSSWRKPEPGMLLDLIATWGVDARSSLMIGDRETDLLAARAAGIAGYRFAGGNLLHFLASLPEFQSHLMAAPQASILEGQPEKGHDLEK